MTSYMLKQFGASVIVLGCLMSTIAYWLSAVPWLAGWIDEAALGRVMWALPWYIAVMAVVPSVSAVLQYWGRPGPVTAAAVPVEAEDEEDEGW